MHFHLSYNSILHNSGVLILILKNNSTSQDDCPNPKVQCIINQIIPPSPNFHHPHSQLFHPSVAYLTKTIFTNSHFLQPFFFF